MVEANLKRTSIDDRRDIHLLLGKRKRSSANGVSIIVGVIRVFNALRVELGDEREEGLTVSETIALEAIAQIYIGVLIAESLFDPT